MRYFLPLQTNSLFTSCLCIILFFLLIAQAFSDVIAEKAKWKHDAKSAYSIVHDDACDYGKEGIFQTAVPMADARDLPLGMGVIVGQCEDKASWLPNYWEDTIAVYAQNGHEIVNHSYTHASAPGWNKTKEVIESKQVIESHIDDEVTFFVFPLDQYDQATLQYLESNGYIGARAGTEPYNDRGVNIPTAAFNPFHSNFQALESNTGILRTYLNEAINKGGWALQEMHEVGTGSSWGIITPTAYESFLDFVKGRVDDGDVWMGTPSNVVKYIKTYFSSGDVSVNNNTITFATPGNVEQKYATEITVILTFDSPPNDSVYVIQDNIHLEVEQIESKEYHVHMDPTKGDAQITLGTFTVAESINQFKKTIQFNQGIVSALLPEGPYSIRLFTVNGRQVSETITGFSIDEKIHQRVNTQGLSEGFYLLDISYNGGRVCSKILLTR